MRVKKSKALIVAAGLTCALSALAPTGDFVMDAPGAVAMAFADEIGQQETNLTEFESKSGGNVECQGGAVSVSKLDGDHFVMSKAGGSYRSLCYEADVKVEDGPSAALVFGVKNADSPGNDTWYGFNFNNESADQRVRLFRVHDDANIATFSEQQVKDEKLDTHGVVHLKAQVGEDGACRVTASDAEGDEVSVKTKIEGWEGGCVGLLTFKSQAKFENVTISEDAGLEGKDPAEGESEFTTDLTGEYQELGSGSAEMVENGLVVDSVGEGDMLLRWENEDNKRGDMVYSADVAFESADVDGAASLVLHSDKAALDKIQAYVANVNPKTGECRLFKWENTTEGHIAYNMMPSIQLGQSVASEFHLSLTTIGKHMVYSVSYQDANGKTITKTASTADYTLGTEDNSEEGYSHYGQNTALRTGYCGVMTFNAKVTFNNLKAVALNANNTPQFEDLNIEGDAVDMPFAFQSTAYVYVGYVKNSAKDVDVKFKTSNDNAEVALTDVDGNSYAVENGRATVPIGRRGTASRNEGLNQFKLTVIDPDTGATVVYQLRIFCEGKDDSYYWEDQRSQYHYSVKNGWGNDPCGMVKTSDGVYHFFYQAYTDTDWGPMHWGYATSEDLVHWEQQPIQLYPDEYGAMFSGCGVYADHSTAPALFNEGEEGMVFVVTANGREGQDGKQRLTLAYATYDQNEKAMGEVKKYDNVLLDYSTDDIIPVADGAFRDPKIFRYDNKWFMIVAGGPVRFYSSENLIDWKGESYLDEPTGGHVYTECPDLYPVETRDGEVKWILSRGGLSYKVGEFKKVGETNVEGGEYEFVQDSDTPDYIANFGRDSYATVTYFNAGDGGDFGTNDKVNCPELVTMSWMNTWDYNKLVQNTGNWRFNGTYNLPIKVGLIKYDDGSYRLTQQPTENLAELREAEGEVEVNDLRIGVDESTVPIDFRGKSYEIEATFTPDGGSNPTVGFEVRVGDGEKTRVSYDFETETITLDRSQSGYILNDAFRQPRSQAEVKHNDDGSVTLHVYVDSMSIEVFTGDYVAAGANQIFPSPASDGLNAFSENGAATLDAKIYPYKSIWEGQRSETPSVAPEAIMLGSSSLHMYAGKEASVSASVSPAVAPQKLTASSSDESIVKVGQKDGRLQLIACGTGKATITVSSAVDSSVESKLQVVVTEYGFVTNVAGMDGGAGGAFWADGNAMLASSRGTNSFLVSSEKYPVTGSSYAVDVKLNDGLVNLLFGMKDKDPYKGCYAVQLRRDGMLRLFDFKNDKTLWKSERAFQVPDSGIVRVEISILDVAQPARQGASAADMTVSVKINNVSCLGDRGEGYTVKGDDPRYSNGYVALGVFDSDKTEFFNFKLDDATASLPVREDMSYLLTELETYDSGKYTADSWQKLQVAIMAAKKIDEYSTYEEVLLAYNNLVEAVKGLVEVGSGEGGETPGGGSDPDDQIPGGDDKPGIDKPGDPDDSDDTDRPGDTGGSGDADKPGEGQNPDSGGGAGSDTDSGTTGGSQNSGSDGNGNVAGGAGVGAGGKGDDGDNADKLPTTGDPAAIVGGVAALGGALASVGAYVAKRRSQR